MGRKSNYENGMYQQLMELMGRLENVEKDSAQKIDTLNKRIDTLENENLALKQENQLLKEDNARLKSIINNDSSNSSLPPSADSKIGKPANTFNGRKKTERKPGGQKGHKGTTLTKAEIEQKIASGKCRHDIKTIGNASGKKFITKYVVDLEIEPVITEIRIYADENGILRIPAEYHSDVTYGANAKALAVSLYSEGVMSNDRIAAFLNAAGKTIDLNGYKLTGTFTAETTTFVYVTGGCELTLLDSLGKRMAWLETVLPQLGVQNAECVTARAEEAVTKCRESYDFATSRAVARLNILLELTAPYVKVGGCVLAMKGAAAREELSEAKNAVQRLGLRLEKVVPFPIDGAEHSVIVLRKVKPTPSQYPRRYAKIKQSPL